MTYQVLARKWRPRSFADLVGQQHVVQALVNGLTRGQLHHAYLFTGTRGVGKTTLARILAKTLNCEVGIGPTPCGVCSTCREIDEGRYVDLLEVDAASRTKVDQTRELLDNVPFSPVRGRFKVYLIDEVHMFSASSFNALLKTLEEPPGHVKFVLATTDPQRLPATVLSRCLQFNLKRLLPEQIRGQFVTVLTAEGIAFEEPALALLASAADGSMRDGLSLLDQAIAFGGGRVSDADVRLMLGTRSGDLILDLATALADGDGARLLEEIGRIALVTPDFAGVLSDLIALLHRVALVQQVPEVAGDDAPERARILDLGRAIAPEDVQLFYQVLLLGQRDLPLAPDPRGGLEMVLLRALAFRPAAGAGPADPPRAAQPAGMASAPPRRSPTAAPIAVRPSAGRPTAAPPPVPGADDRPPAPASLAAVPAPGGAFVGTISDAADWRRFSEGAGLTGMATELARHSAFIGWDGPRLRLALEPSLGHLRSSGTEQRLSAALTALVGEEVKLDFASAQPPPDTTPAAQQARDAAARQAEAVVTMTSDPVAAELQARFGARLITDSIEPLN